MSASTSSGVKCSNFLEYLQSPMIIVHVGHQKKAFHVHQALICSKSAFFQNASTQTSPPIVNLEQVSVQLFNVFYSWLYNGQLVFVVPKDSNTSVREEFLPLLCKDHHEIQEDQSPRQHAHSVENQDIPVKIEREDTGDGNPEPATSEHVNSPDQDQGQPEAPADDVLAITSVDAKDAKTWPIDVIVKLYTFGHYLEAQLFKNELMNVIVDHATGCIIHGVQQHYHHPTRPLVRFVYNNTPSGSPLRNIIFDLMVYQQAWHEPMEAWKGLPEEFLIMVMVSLGRRLPSKLCSDCYRKAIDGNDLMDARVVGLCLNKDRALFESSACYYHEHGTEEEREECKKDCRKERKAKRRELKAMKLTAAA